MSSQWAALSLSRSISFPLSLPSPLPFRCAFINYVGFLMISALLLSRVLSPAPSTFSACSLFFRWQVHIFLSLPSRPCISSCSSFLSLSFSFKPSSTHTTFACFITQEKSKLSAASFASKREKRGKKENFFTSSRWFGCRELQGGGGVFVSTEVWRMLHFISHFSSTNFRRFFLPLAFQIIQP